MSPAATDEERARLRQLVLFDIATAATAVAVMSVVFALVEPSPWLFALNVLVGASGLLMAAALVPVRRGNLTAAVAWLAAANWFIAPAATVIAVFVWPLMMLAALLPAVMAAPYVSGARLRRYVVASFAVAIVVVVVGLFQDVTEFGDELPGWLPPATLVVFTPFLAGMVVVTALQHSSRLQAALADTLAANQALRDSRARLVVATDRARRQVERDLHDGAQQRLVAIGIGLRRAQDLCSTDPAAAGELLTVAREEVRTAIVELRDLAHGIYPAVLTGHGLGPALAAAADRCPLRVELEVGALGRYPAEVEAAVYFCSVEAMQNAAKHAGADACVRLSARDDDGALVFTVADDGVGFDTATTSGAGLDGMLDRIGAAGGDLEIRSDPEGGTVVSGVVHAHR